MKKISGGLFLGVFILYLIACSTAESPRSDDENNPDVPGSQYQNILVGESLSFKEPEETTIVIDPNNCHHMVAGANNDNFYYSTDSGYTWTHGLLISTYGVFCDPCIQIDSRGNYYYFHLNPRTDRVVCQKSTGPGEPWTDGTFTGLNGNKDQDKEWAVIDRENNIIYISWSEFDRQGSKNPVHKSLILLSKSEDGGETWSTPVKVSNKSGDSGGGNGSVHASMPAVGPSGEVFVTWMSPDGLMLNISNDRGNTWLKDDIPVTDFPIQWLYNIPGLQRAPGFPILVCDLSSKSTRGNLYITWADQRSGANDTDIWLVKSRDGGYTWSSPLRVNDDPPGKHQFFSWLTVDQTNGNLYLVFYDRRHHTDSGTDVYMAISRDGGKTFSNVKVNEKSFIPTAETFLGDYIGIAAHNNIIRPLWARIDNKSLSIWTAIINF